MTPLDCSPPGSSVHGTFQARELEWSGLPFPSSGHLPHPGIESESLALAGDSSPLSHQGSQIRGHYCTKQPHLKRVSVWDGFSPYMAPLLADSCVLLFPLFPISILSLLLSKTRNQLSSPDDMVCPGFSCCYFTEIDVAIDLRWVSQGISGLL